MSLQMTFEFRAAAVLVVALAAVVFDVRTRRIPNALTFGAAGAGLAFALMTGGLSAAAGSLLGWIVGAGLFFPIFALRGMGAGDVKLLAALGAWLGAVDVLYLALFASMAGGVVALAVAMSRGYLGRAFANLWLMLMHWRVAGPSPVPGLTLRDTRAPRLAYAIPIAIGVLCTLWRH
jgi:prepilin peptidase CpaA